MEILCGDHARQLEYPTDVRTYNYYYLKRIWNDSDRFTNLCRLNLKLELVIQVPL